MQPSKSSWARSYDFQGSLGASSPCHRRADDMAKALKKNGVPLAMASVSCKDSIELDLLVNDVGGAYDFWISCLLATTHRPAYYVAERLTRYRVHSAMETARQAPDKFDNMVFIYRALIDLNKFHAKNTLLTSRYSEALYNAGKSKLLFNYINDARNNFIISKGKHKEKIISTIICLLSTKEYALAFRNPFLKLQI